MPVFLSLLLTCLMTAVETRSSAGTPFIEVRDTLALYCQGRRVGALVHSRERDSTSGATVEWTSLKALNWMNAGNADTMVMDERRAYRSDGDLDEASQSLRGAAGTTFWTLQRRAGEWLLTINAGGVATSRKVGHVPDNDRADREIYAAVRYRSLTSGDRWVDTAFDMTSGMYVATTTTYLAQHDSAGAKIFTFSVFDNLSMRKQEWLVDDRCRTVSQEIPPVFTAQRAEVPDRTSADSLRAFFTVRADRPPSAAESMVLRLDSTVELDDSIRILYRRQPPVWLVHRPVGSCVDSDILPVPDSLKTLIRPTVTLQCDHPDIKRVAAEIAGGRKSACDAIARLTMYVYRSLAKRNTATYSNAVETLHAGFGDCGEHAVLLAALLRAVGIPCRVVLGLVYVGSSGGYCYHAWVAVPSRAGWLFADPAFGRFPATHPLVPLMFDDQGQNGVLISRLMGAIKIEYRPAGGQ